MFSLATQALLLAPSSSSPSSQQGERVTLDAIQLATYFVIETVIRLRDPHVYAEWMGVLKGLYTASHTACRWFLDLLVDSKTQWFKHMLLECFGM